MKIRAAITALFACSALQACASTGGYGGGGGAGVSLREERVVIGSFADVQGVAVSRRYVFSATPSGVAIYDRAFSRWLPPLTSSGQMTNDQITVLAADPVEDALWYGIPGAVVVYRPQVDQLQRTLVLGVPDLIAFDRSGTGDAFVRSGAQWTRITRTGAAYPMSGAPPAARVQTSGTINDVYRQYPALRTQLSFIMRENLPNRALRQFTAISGALSPDRATEAWIGTNGDGLWRVDPAFMQGEPLRFGPMEAGVGALAPAANGVWTTGLGRSPRGGLSFASNDLQRWEWIDGTIAVPLVNVRTFSMAVRASRAWLGTDRGLVRVQLDGSRDIVSWTLLDGLPGERAFAVAARDNGAWVGTDRGLAFVSDTSETRDRDTRGVSAPMLVGQPVYALAQAGDSLFVGSETGLYLLSSGASSPARIGTDPQLRRPIRALGWSDSVVFVATDDGLLQIGRRSGNVQRLDLDVRMVGQITRLVVDERAIFLAGSDGVLVLLRDGGLQRQMRSGFDIPGAALDIVASRDWIWIATPGGLVRVRRAADGGLP